jgi:hypothetical protein
MADTQKAADFLVAVAACNMERDLELALREYFGERRLFAPALDLGQDDVALAAYADDSASTLTPTQALDLLGFERQPLPLRNQSEAASEHIEACVRFGLSCLLNGLTAV